MTSRFEKIADIPFYSGMNPCGNTGGETAKSLRGCKDVPRRTVGEIRLSLGVILSPDKLSSFVDRCITSQRKQNPAYSVPHISKNSAKSRIFCTLALFIFLGILNILVPYNYTFTNNKNRSF